MTREQMIDEVVKTNGLENKWTIWFCELAEDASISDSALLNAMICATTMPEIEDTKALTKHLIRAIIQA